MENQEEKNLDLLANLHLVLGITVAFLECLIMPLGTVLGIFTILNLNKDKTKELFIS